MNTTKRYQKRYRFFFLTVGGIVASRGQLWITYKYVAQYIFLSDTLYDIKH